MMWYDYYCSPIGNILLRGGKEGLNALDFYDEKELQLKISGLIKNDEKFLDVKKYLDIYFSGKNPDFTPRISLNGTDFQMRVWSYLMKIPYGKTATYGEIAKVIAMERGIPKMSSQAVGGALNKNPIPIIVPCHRVIGKNGSLVGFGCGIDKKRYLLDLEKDEL